MTSIFTQNAKHGDVFCDLIQKIQHKFASGLANAIAIHATAVGQMGTFIYVITRRIPHLKELIYHSRL